MVHLAFQYLQCLYTIFLSQCIWWVNTYSEMMQTITCIQFVYTGGRQTLYMYFQAYDSVTQQLQFKRKKKKTMADVKCLDMAYKHIRFIKFSNTNMWYGIQSYSIQ